MKLGDFIQINPKVRLEKNALYPFVEMKVLDPSVRSVSTQVSKKYSGSGSKFETGDTLLARITPCLENGKTSQYVGKKTPAWGSTEFIILRQVPEKSDNGFIYYLARSPEFRAHAVQSMVGTSGRQRVPNDAVQNYEYEMPPLDEQKAIAHILGTLDGKIELNQKMNLTLENIAEAIFKSWFVDFDPVRAKAEGRPTSLPGEISDLFPDAFEDSEIGEIPAGWEIKFGSELYSHQKGLSYKGDSLSDSPSDIPMLNLGSFAANGGYREEKLKFYSGEFKDRHCICEGELLLANTDLTQDRLVIGSPILVPSTPSGHRFYLHTHHTTKIIPRKESELTNIFLYFTFLQNSFRERVSGFATGTTVLALPKDTFDALQLIVPPQSARTKFEKIVTPMLARRTLIATENRYLRELRDTLLPKLISGELRIPDAEKFLAEAGI